jgi:transposase InsO family protein
MDEVTRKSIIAVFRYGVISDFVGLRKLPRGEKERLLTEKALCMWDIPFSGRSRISRSTILHWLRRYLKAGRSIESLHPEEREDKGTVKSIDPETMKALLLVRRELGGPGLPVILKEAHLRKILPPDFRTSPATLYRIFQRAGRVDRKPTPRDMRRFEKEAANELWQSDALHGPRVLAHGKLRKAYLLAFIDDHSRLIPHAEFYLSEGLDSYMACLRMAISKRGIPDKLYVDNGSAFRSHHLGHVTACLGTALIHSKPYQPEGRGKIERWFKTVRLQLLPTIKDGLALPELNRLLGEWIDKDYHVRIHSSTKQTPLSRYLAHIKTIREAPKDMEDYFRKRAVRRVDKDRTISLDGRIYEAPVELVEQAVTLLYHEHDPARVEAFWNNRSYGMLAPVNLVVNCRIKRDRHSPEIVSDPPGADSGNEASDQSYGGGRLFERGGDDHDEL